LHRAEGYQGDIERSLKAALRGWGGGGGNENWNDLEARGLKTEREGRKGGTGKRQGSKWTFSLEELGRRGGQ